MKKRITALLLCLVMVFSLIPTSVWASDPPATDTGSGGVEEQDPDALTEEGVKTILMGSNALVAVKCINPNGGCNVNPVKYGLAASTFTMEENEENGYTLTVEAAPFVAAYSKSGQGRGLPHDLYSAETLTWKLSLENDVWTVKPAVEGVDDTILVTHIPEATYDVLKSMQGGINTRCVNKTTAYTNYGVIAGLVGESAASAQVVKNADGAYILTVSTKNFADSASKHNDRVHDLLTGETANFVLSLSKNDAGKYVWTATPVTELDGICEVAHRVKVTFDQNYTNAPAATEAMYKYDTAEVMEGAFPADPSRSGYVFQGWNTKADGTGDAFIEATAVTEDVTVYAQWGQLHPVKLVIYRNGDTSKAYKTVSLDPQLKGTPIDLTQLKISDYYTGNYKFYGWYNDGKWNEYLKNPDNAPAGLEKITVNGWTNLKCMVYDYETVVYFETEEALKAYQADHSKTEGIMKTTTALHGSTLPTVDAPDTNNRAGYTFQNWSREGQSVDVTGQTVNGWTNLYGNWTIIPHNIYAFARLNSAFAPLTKAEFGGFIKLNATTLKDNLGLDVEYNENGYISIGTFNFDAMPLTEDMYFGDDAELTAVKAQSINLENGVSTGTAEKIDWTFLYQVDNSDYMTAAGYPTNDETGYQLAGNMNVAAVMFNAGGDNVKNMPAVNYTYDDGFYQIHDFYFAGKDFTLPTDPTREGYIFKGWSAAVIPGEDDADCYADPTTDAGAETQTLYKAGDTYTITNGGVIFTAQWEKKTYTIAASLYVNDSASPVMVDSGAYKWTHRYGGEYGDTIDYQPMIDALKARALEVDAANEPYADATKVTLYFPGSDKVFNTAVTTYGQNTARWQEINGSNIAYIKGVATTSYEVIFNTGDGSKVDTQIVKYGELATEPTTELKGYDFLGWFDADGNPFDFNNTEITHKTTLTAKWEKKTYIIASDLRINGGDANLADGKTYPWSYRYGGKFEETIDYTEMFDALKTRAMKVDEANGPVDSVVTLCFPGDYPATAKKLFNDTILTYGQDGGGWNPGNKNTAPIWGFATNVYAVTFNYKDDKTATATQNVEYGNMATEPQKVDRPGYRFLGWFTEDGKAFDFSTPITKSMTLTAKWEIVNINAYIIPITSDGTQLVGAGFDMALNTTTLGRVGLPGYEDEDAVRIHFATFASSAGLADANDYFPGTDPLVVKAVADLKNGLERRFAAGVNEAKADGIMSKTNWTYLHVGELDDEEDTNFLSGNLVFYSARFVTEDSEHVTGMPNAEYTHNAVAVYDYYLDGETITIPDAVPERYGYDFLGWSVKAVPAENDKLLKAGDTVTVDGDVVFTAQWKLKEYTVSFDSKGGTKVDSQIVEHGSTATKPGNPHRNDYTFKGWYLDGKKFDFSTPITGDITLVARWATKTSGGSNGSSDTTTKDNGKTVQSGKTFDGGIALYVGLSVLSATGSALVITKKKRG